MKHSPSGTVRKLLFLLTGLLCAIGVNAQSISVSGTVIDHEGEPLIGASVLVEGTSTGVSTDLDGNFTVNAAPTATLVISYVGYDPMRVPVYGRTNLGELVMQANSVMLNEVVAIGYGTVKKSDATGSVAVIKPDEIEAGLATSVQDMLVGQTPGVVVTTSGGPEGAANIRIRGGSSLNASNDPLIVVDGVPLDNTGVQGMSNSLAMISPDNIESMTVLKDASATAIYGSRASNGVIIITTKKGRSGRPQVNFSANMYVNTARKTLDVMDASTFRQAVAQIYGEGSPAWGKLGNASTKWQDEVLRTTVSSDFNLAVGGTAGGWLPYRGSVSYTNSNGILKGSKMDRVTLGFNLSPKFFDDHLSINANVKGYYLRNKFSDSGAVNAAIGYDPTQPVYIDRPIVAGNSNQTQLFNGYFQLIQTDGNGLTKFMDNATINPLSMLEERDNYANVWRSNGNIQFDYSFHFLPELHANLNLGYDVSESKEYNNVAANSGLSWKDKSDAHGGAWGNNIYQFKSNTLLDFYLNYKKDFEAIYSNLDVTAGYSWQRFYAEGHNSGSSANSGYLRGPGYSYPQALGNGDYSMNLYPGTGINVGLPFQNDPIGAGGNYHWANHLQLLSFFGRINYIYRERYLFTFTMRGDATSRFSKDNRWGAFPSVALGWKINDEAFMESTAGWLSDLKLRLGWGMTGQQDCGGYYNYMALYNMAQPGSYYPNGLGGWYTPYYPEGYNPDLKWETTTTWNAGLDFGFMNNRITGSIDYYLRKTKDLLSFVTVPAGSSTTNMLNRNIGKLENYGLEFNLSAKPVVTDDFTWTLSYNIAWNHNKITELNDNAAIIAQGGISAGTGNTVQAFAVGYPAFTYYLYQQVYDAAGRPVEGVFVDQNGDGQIDQSDKILNHSRDPKVTMTFGSQFRYKQWDFGFNLRASIGNYVYNDVLANGVNYSRVNGYGLNNLLVADQYFQGTCNGYALSDYFLRNGSFLRCENITLGYNFEHLLNDNLRLRLFAGVQNPFIITKYKGLDPEVFSGIDKPRRSVVVAFTGLDPEVFSGIDNNVYPKATTYSLGLVATF